MNRIFLAVNGGLGNQLFQIAAGYYMKQKLGRVVCLVLMDEVNTPEKLGIIDFLGLLGMESAPVKDFAHLDLRDFEIDNLSDFSTVPGEILITGYFQDWRIVNELDDFVNLLKQSVTNNSWVEDFIQSNENDFSVSIHYRLGDYFNNLHALGVLDVSYYKAALSKLDLILPHKFLVFSDSPERAARIFRRFIPKYTLVDDSNATSPLQVLIALSSSSQMILGNSTFSWWAAYIGDQNKRVVPFPFYRNLARDFLLPPTWERVPSKFLKTEPSLWGKIIGKLKILLGVKES